MRQNRRVEGVYMCVCVLGRCRMRNVFCGSICGRDRGGSLDLVITVGRWFLIRVEIERFQGVDRVSLMSSLIYSLELK